jgi:8-oxo-dGTP pyrophosphatase MutT (NUDIX family)
MVENNKQNVYRQSGVIPYTIKDGKLLLLLITSISKGNWIIPKGIIDDGFSPQESAMNEAYEEAGVRGQIDNKIIGAYNYHKWGGRCEVQVFAYAVTEMLDEWPEMHMRERAWFSKENAAEQIKNPDLRDVVQRFITQFKIS